MKDRVAVFGLGNMGYPLAGRVARKLDTQVFDLDHARMDAAAAEFRATPVHSFAEVAGTRFIVLCLPHPKASIDVLQNIRPYLRDDAVVIETSTVNASDIKRAAQELNDVGATLIDASILAGVSQMQAGSATLLLGGDEAAITASRAVLDAIAEKQVYFGDLGTGASAKVINNAVAHAVMVVVCEAGAMATASGVNIERLIGLLSDPEMGLHRPLTFRYAKRVMQSDYDGGMPLSAARKDSELALQMAQETGVPLFAIQACHSPYEIGVGAGYGREDYAVIARLWDDWGRPTVPKC